MKIVNRLFFLVALALAPAAQAELTLTGLAGFNFHNPDATGVGYSPEAKFSYGALVGLGTPYSFSFETGLIMVNKESSLLDVSVLDYDAWELPLLLRFNVIPLLSLGAGGYWQVHDKDDVANTSSNDFGLKGSARLTVPLVPTVRFVLEGQYNYGLKDMAAGSAEFKNREFLALTGLQFGI